jgi:hypothetical protein
MFYVNDSQISFHRYKAVISWNVTENSFHECRQISRERSIQCIP